MLPNGLDQLKEDTCDQTPGLFLPCQGPARVLPGFSLAAFSLCWILSNHPLRCSAFILEAPVAHPFFNLNPLTTFYTSSSVGMFIPAAIHCTKTYEQVNLKQLRCLKQKQSTKCLPTLCNPTELYHDRRSSLSMPNRKLLFPPSQCKTPCSFRFNMLLPLHHGLVPNENEK